MTADEIRKIRFACDDGQWQCAYLLQEIAAQLAELNSNLKSATEEAHKLQLDFLRGDVQ